jgi:cation:H+ antiporter
MIVEFSLFLLGLIALTYGAKWLIDGSMSIALAFGISPLIVGMSIIAFGTSMPEFVFNLTSANSGASDLAVGNVVGSNIANIALILGITACIKPVKIPDILVKREYLFMVLTTFLFIALSLDGEINRFDGIMLVIILIGFFYWLFRSGKAAEEVNDLQNELIGTSSWIKKGASILLGLAGLLYGAHLMVESATIIALNFGVPEMVIGVTIVAFGTSLPELAASLTAVLKHQHDMSIGNIIGSNIFNVLFVIGFVTIIAPISIIDVWTIPFHMLVMAFVVLSILPFYFIGKRIGKFGGLILLAMYIIYLFFCYRIVATGGL